MKAGLMEIANVFVVNKTDRPDAATFIKNLRLMLAPVFSASKNEIEIVATSATTNSGTEELLNAIKKYLLLNNTNEKKTWLQVQYLYSLIQKHKMKNIDKQELYKMVVANSTKNIYALLQNYK